MVVKVTETVTEQPTVTGTENKETVKMLTTIADLRTAAAEDDFNIVVGADLEETGNGVVMLQISKAGKIDLNGHTLKAVSDVLFVNGTKVEISGSGLIQSTGDCAIWGDYGADITISDINVKAQEAALLIQRASKLTVKSGTFETVDNFVVGTNGSNGRGSNVITIDGGTFNGNIQSAGYIACGIYLANSDTLTVNGGTFNITNGCGILARSGHTTVGKDVVINLANDANNQAQGKVGDSKVMVLTGAYIVKDNAAHYPGGEPSVTNNSIYSVTELNEYKA